MRLRGVDRKHCFQLQQFARCSLHVVRTHRFQFWLDERRCGSGSGQSVIHSVPVTARFPLSTSRFSPMPTEMSAQQMPFSEGYIECGDGCLYLRLLGSWSRRQAGAVAEAGRHRRPSSSSRTFRSKTTAPAGDGGSSALSNVRAGSHFLSSLAAVGAEELRHDRATT